LKCKIDKPLAKIFKKGERTEVKKKKDEKW
jgi:hypothetical protein